MAEPEINWLNPECQASRYFTVKDCIYLPQWGRLAGLDDGLTKETKYQIKRFLDRVMDPVRIFLDRPIRVHCLYRPPTYNELVGGSLSSSHQILGPWAACDFDVEELTCGEVGALLLPRLESFGARMENHGNDPSWIHLDSHPVITSRYFKP